MLNDIERVGTKNYFFAVNSYIQFGVTSLLSIYGITLPEYEVRANGDGARRDLTGVPVSAVSPDERYLYSVSPVDNAVGVYDRTTGDWSTFFDGYEVPVGALEGVTSIAVSSAGNVQYAVVVSPVTGTLTTFRTENGTTTTTYQTNNPGLVGVSSLAYSSGSLYTMTGTAIRRYAMSADMGSLGTVQATLSGSGLTAIQLDNGRLYSVFANGSGIRTLDAASLGTLSSIGGLSNITALAFADSTIYATSSDGILYHLVDTGSSIELRGTYVNNVSGIRGLSGAKAVSVDGRYVFVAGQTESSIAVFLRDESTGSLTFVQSVRDGRAANGINQPSGLWSIDGQLIVASAIGRNGNRGGFATLDVVGLGDAQPINVDTTFSNFEGLKLVGGNQNDLVRVLAAPALPVTIETDAGEDVVTVSDVGPRGTTLSIDTGTGDDQVNVLQSIDRSAGSGSSTLTIAPGFGNDDVNLQNLPVHTNVQVSMGIGGNEIDVTRVRGDGVPASSFVQVDGDGAPGNFETFSGDALIYDGQASIVPAAGVTENYQGTVAPSVAGLGNVAFNNMWWNPPTPAWQQVFLTSAPRPTLNGVTLSEGGTVQFTAGDLSGQANVTYAWDLDGDGAFDAEGQQISLSWEQLKAFGIDDNGTYPIAVRATSSQNPVQFGGRAYQLSADASALVTVLNTAPTLTAPSGSPIIGVPFAVELSATDPGNDRVQQWVVNWGDGNPNEYFGADAASATHVYARVGNFTITVLAIDEDAETYQTGDVQVRPGAGTVSIGTFTSAIDEGGVFTATAQNVGTPIRYEWDFGANGNIDVVTASPTLQRTWLQLTGLGITDNGAYSLRVTAVYSDGSSEYPATSNSVNFTVANAAPSGVLSLNTASVPEGSTGGAVQVTVTAYADPAPADTSSTARVDLDFDINGTMDLADQPVGAPINVPALLLTTAGSRTVRAVLRDKDGGSRELFATFDVTGEPTTLSIDPVAAIDESESVSLTVRANDPGGVAIESWLILWGDGSSEEVTGNGQAVQTFKHPYADGAIGGTSYAISVTARTAGGEVTASTTATVNDVAPSVTLSAPTSSVNEGETDAFTLHLAIDEPGDDTVVGLVINWGDGTSETVTGDTTEVTHTYTDVPLGGTASVSVTELTNDDGVFANPANTLIVTVTNAAPVILTDLLNIPEVGDEATSIDLTAIAASVVFGSEPLTFTWSIHGPGGTTVYPATQGDVFLADPNVLSDYEYASHGGIIFTSADNGDYTMTLTVTDDDNGTATITRTISIANRAPTIDTFSVPDAGTEGQPVELAATASDPAGAEDILIAASFLAGSRFGEVQTKLYEMQNLWLPATSDQTRFFALQQYLAGKLTNDTSVDTLTGGAAIDLLVASLTGIKDKLTDKAGKENVISY